MIMATLNDLNGRIAAVHARIRAAEIRAGRPAGSVQLLCVSKTQPAEAVAAAAAAGERHFGENYVQEGVDKILALRERGLHWHFIGPLQSNKTRLAAAHFDWVHSVDSLKLAQRLNDQRPEGLPPLQVCLQVNTSGEATKSGIDPAALPALAEAVARLPRLHLRGLMHIPAPGSDEAVHRRLAALLQPGMDTLSMGMSDDLEAAVAAGASWVRVGTAIFGART
jgi:hypothetical protein